MTRFRPCIDLHAGQVKQIVGGTLDSATAALQTNFVASQPPRHFAELYRQHDLHGAHVIMLGSGPANVAAGREAVAAWPGGLQIGGGIRDSNAAEWIAAGADKVIVTSFLFEAALDGVTHCFSQTRLDAVLAALGGDPDRLVIDLSCRRVASSTSSTSSTPPSWAVAINKWQTLTDMLLSKDTLSRLAPYCSEFLVHAADVEGLQSGIDKDLVASLAAWSADLDRPITYAGGARSLADLDLVHRLSGGRLDLTIGSALDCFGGSGVKLADCIAWNNSHPESPSALSSVPAPAPAPAPAP